MYRPTFIGKTTHKDHCQFYRLAELKPESGRIQNPVPLHGQCNAFLWATAAVTTLKKLRVFL